MNKGVVCGHGWAYGLSCLFVARSADVTSPAKMRSAPKFWPLPDEAKERVVAQCFVRNAVLRCLDTSVLDASRLQATQPPLLPSATGIARRGGGTARRRRGGAHRCWRLVARHVEIGLSDVDP